MAGAIFELGMIYKQGRFFVQKDEARARHIFEAGASIGEPQCVSALSNLHASNDETNIEWPASENSEISLDLMNRMIYVWE